MMTDEISHQGTHDPLSESEALNPLESDPRLVEATSLYQRGRKLTFDDPDEAVSLLEQSLKLHVDLGLGTDVRAAVVYLAYGLALVSSFLPTHKAMCAHVCAVRSSACLCSL